MSDSDVLMLARVVKDESNCKPYGAFLKIAGLLRCGCCNSTSGASEKQPLPGVIIHYVINRIITYHRLRQATPEIVTTILHGWCGCATQMDLENQPFTVPHSPRVGAAGSGTVSLVPVPK